MTRNTGADKVTRRVERWVLVASILGSAMVFVDGTVVNVALPTLQQSLGATGSEVQWVVESYMLTLSALLLLGGSLGDKLGRRRMFSAGVSLFTVASVACALSPGIISLIIARGVQGIGGALLTPGSLALIAASIPAERRGRAIGKWSGFSAAAAGIGPVLGGWLIEQISWRAIFWLNLPIAAITLLITIRYVPESRNARAGKLDWGGAVLATLGLGGLVFGLLEAQRFGFVHPLILSTLVGGIILLSLFVVLEARSTSPMLPLQLFSSANFAGVNLITLLLYAALGGALFFLPFNLVQVHRYSPAQAGAALLPLIVLMTLLSGWAGRLIDRHGARRPLIVGPLIVAVGYALLSLAGTGGSYWSTFFPGMTVLGLGMSVTVAPLTTTVMESVAPARAGLASGINNAVSRMASLLAIAVFGVAAYESFGRSLVARLDALRLSPSVRQLMAEERGKLAAAAPPTSLPPEVRRAVDQAIDAAFVDAFRLLVLLAAALAAASAFCAWLLIRGKHSGPRRGAKG